MRLFVGIALANETIVELARVCARLRKPADGLRWSAEESWHITLQFLGNAGEAQVECLKARLAEVRSAPVPVQLGSANIFDRAGAFVVDVILGEELIMLQKRVVEATGKCAFVPEERAFHPHITLARAKGDSRRQLKELKTRVETVPKLPIFIANAFLLYESHLGPGGSKYEVQGRFPLSKG
jgi:RNA 2',3'-cyclic 3'-phosphodiesterase